MALLNVESTLRRVCTALGRLSPPGGFEILSYKRNRGIVVLKQEDGRFFVRQRGYEEGEYQVTEDELPRLLRTIMKREFPRSRKLRVYPLARPEEAGQPRKRL